VFQDLFDRAWDSQSRFIDYKGWSEGEDVSIGDWDGFLGGADSIVAYNYIDGFPYASGEDVEGHRTPTPGTPDDPEELNGVLLISSKNSRWDEDNNSGVFLYKNVEGDFIAEVEIVSRDYWGHHGGGLMVRVDNPDMTIDSEEWLYVSHVPVDDVGNHARSIIDGEGGELGVKGYPSDPFLQMERRGDTFFLRTSPDGVLWTSLPGIEQGLVRADMTDTIQLGIWQATYSDIVGTMMFDNFSIVPEPATVALLGLGALALVCWKRS
jgi:regulation of enolase protein 1 (concanavalin A-like superfamily)